MTIAELTDKIRAFRDARDWSQFHKPKDMAAALAIEAGELQEHFLWKTDLECREHLVKHKADVAGEMADIANYLFMMAGDAQINLADAIQTKLEQNERRYPVEKARGSHRKYTEYQDEGN